MSITISLARCAPWLFGALAFLGVFSLCQQYVLHDFYNLGAVRDTYWFAGLFWQNGWRMTDPPAASFFPDGSFFYTHLSPFLYLPNALSYLFSMGPNRWYALVYGLMHASLTLGVFCLSRRILPASRMASGLAALLASAFAFNGNAVVALQMPHFEIAIPALILLMLALMCTARFGWASLALAATLTLREDAGFHVVAFLATPLLVRRYFASNFETSSMDRWAARFVIIAFCYSLATFLLQRTLYGDNGMLWNNYLGSPPFAHMTHDVFSERLHLYLQERSYIWAPFLLTLIWAALARNPLIPLGFVAELPWLALHLTAKVPVVGEMAWYYGFPFIVSIAWPLVAVWWWRGGLFTARERRQTSAAFALVLTSTLVGQVQERFLLYPLALFSNVSPVGTVMTATDKFVASAWTNQAELGHLRVDPGVRGLAPQRFAAKYWLESPLQRDSRVDSIIWFDPGARDSEAWATWINERLNYHYEIPGTQLVMASNRRPEQLPALRPLIKPTSLLMRRLQPTANAQRTTEGIVVRDTASSGPVTTGPYVVRETGLYRAHSMSLPAGHYEITLRLKLAAHPTANDFDALLGIWLEYPWAEDRVRLKVQSNKVQLLASGDYEIYLPFQVDETQAINHWTGLFNLVLEHYANSEQWTLRDARLISQ